MMAGRSGKFGGRYDSGKSSPVATAEPVTDEVTSDGNETELSEEKQETEIYHVVGPASLLRGGEKLAPGELLELTEMEAKDLGAVVAPGKPPPKTVQTGTRGAGKYRVKGPGSVLQGGVLRKPGKELNLSEEDARSLGDVVEPV